MADCSSPSGRPPIPPRASYQRVNLRKWSSGQRRATGWDFLRRDPDLWFEDADCLVHLYSKGHSQRGASFAVPIRLLVSAHCTPLLAQAGVQTGPPSENCFSRRSRSMTRSWAGTVELYLPAPQGFTRDEVFRYHLVTRNFFAWVCHQPLVGHHLGPVLADLLERMDQWRASGNDHAEDLLIYADQMGYSAVENCPDFALTMLYFAEKCAAKNVWIDSFAHCVGMNERVVQSSEYAPISEATKALITRAYLEMDLHVERSSRALTTFLEEQLSPARFGISLEAHHHLDHFRSFLQSFCVSKFGYWPLAKPSSFPKDQYRALYKEVCYLYNFLADKNFGGDARSWSKANGGICTQQNIEAFNARQRFEPLPFTMPLLPETPSDPARPQKSLRSLRVTSRESRASRSRKDIAQLRAASNMDDNETLQSPLVWQFMAFEDEETLRLEDKVTLADARKVRWMLVYGMLQTLVSILQAPPEVRETVSPKYPLCVLTAEMPKSSRPVPSQHTKHPGRPSTASSDMRGRLASGAVTPTISIRPDCDYLESDSTAKSSHTSLSSAQTPDDALSRTSNKSSFLRKPSKIMRNFSKASKRSSSVPPQRVSGRTLAELAYGQCHEAGSDGIQGGFDFGFTVSREPASIAWPARTGTTPTYCSRPTSSHSVQKSPSSDVSASSCSTNADDVNTSTPSSPTSGDELGRSDSSSAPSLTHSRDSSYGSDSEPSASPVHESTFFDKLAFRTPGLNVVAGQYPGSQGLSAIPSPLRVNGVTPTAKKSDSLHPYSGNTNTDYFTDMPTAMEKSNSVVSTPAGPLDRAAVVEMNGAIDDETVEMYRALVVQD